MFRQSNLHISFSHFQPLQISRSYTKYASNYIDQSDFYYYLLPACNNTLNYLNFLSLKMIYQVFCIYQRFYFSLFEIAVHSWYTILFHNGNFPNLHSLHLNYRYQTQIKDLQPSFSHHLMSYLVEKKQSQRCQTQNPQNLMRNHLGLPLNLQKFQFHCPPRDQRIPCLKTEMLLY